MKSIDFTTPGMITSLRIGCYQIESPVNNIWKATFEANTNNASTDLNDEFHKNKLAFHFFKARYSHMWGYQMFLSDARQTGIFFSWILGTYHWISVTFGRVLVGDILQKSSFSVMGFTDRGSIGWFYVSMG